MNKATHFLCLCALVFPTLTSANQTSYFYVSANTGIFQGVFDNTYLDQTDAIPQNIAQTANQHGYTLGAALGYRHLLQEHYFWGIELLTNVDGHNAAFKSGASTTAFSDNVQIQYHTDLTFTPGLQLNESILAYLKLGLSFAALQDRLNSPTGFTPVLTDYNTNKNALGFTAGLGLSKAITHHISIVTEANYHDYGTVNFNNFQNFSASYTHSSHVYSYDITIGAMYRFDL